MLKIESELPRFAQNPYRASQNRFIKSNEGPNPGNWMCKRRIEIRQNGLFDSLQHLALLYNNNKVVCGLLAKICDR